MAANDFSGPSERAFWPHLAIYPGLHRPELLAPAQDLLSSLPGGATPPGHRLSDQGAGAAWSRSAGARGSVPGHKGGARINKIKELQKFDLEERLKWDLRGDEFKLKAILEAEAEPKVSLPDNPCAAHAQGVSGKGRPL